MSLSTSSSAAARCQQSQSLLAAFAPPLKIYQNSYNNFRPFSSETLSVVPSLRDEEWPKSSVTPSLPLSERLSPWHPLSETLSVAPSLPLSVAPAPQCGAQDHRGRGNGNSHLPLFTETLEGLGRFDRVFLTTDSKLGAFGRTVCFMIQQCEVKSTIRLLKTDHGVPN